MLELTEFSKFKLAPCVDLRFPDFEKHYQAGITAKAYFYKQYDCRQWHQEFLARVFDAQEKRQFLPIYRVSHGEFIMALGYQHSQPWYRRHPKENVSLFIRRLFDAKSGFRSGSQEYGYEEFTKAELIEARQRFLKYLSLIANKGILAIALHDTTGYKAYIPNFLNWLNDNKIFLNPSNYFHFYSVYTLMHSNARQKLLRGKRILVVTGLTEGKKLGIEAGLVREGVADVQFIPVSANKALFDTLDFDGIKEPIDLVLIGAGVGSINVLVQLERLQAVCIDVGFCLSTLSDPTLRWNRPFCVPDDEFDISKITYRVEVD